MNNKEFINNLSSTYADIRRLNAKIVDAKKIKLNGENIEDLLGFQDPADFKKLCKRVKMDDIENEYYELINDEGEIMYINIPEGVSYVDLFCRTGVKQLILKNESLDYLCIDGCKNIEYLEIDTPNVTSFRVWDHTGYENVPYFLGGNYSKLKTFKGDISGIWGMDYMCMGCSDLEDFNAKLPTTVNEYYSDAYGAFFMCNLNSESVKHILDSLPENMSRIHITMNEAAVAEFNNITGNTGEIPLCDGDYIDRVFNWGEDFFSVSYKNCTIYPSINVFTSESINELI